jgi:hypothetical protein
VVDRGGTTQAIRPFGVCTASDAVEMRAKGVGVPTEAFVMRRTLAQCKMKKMKKSKPPSSRLSECREMVIP